MEVGQCLSSQLGQGAHVDQALQTAHVFSGAQFLFGKVFVGVQ